MTEPRSYVLVLTHVNDWPPPRSSIYRVGVRAYTAEEAGQRFNASGMFAWGRHETLLNVVRYGSRLLAVEPYDAGREEHEFIEQVDPFPRSEDRHREERGQAVGALRAMVAGQPGSVAEATRLLKQFGKE